MGRRGRDCCLWSGSLRRVSPEGISKKENCMGSHGSDTLSLLRMWYGTSSGQGLGLWHCLRIQLRGSGRVRPSRALLPCRGRATHAPAEDSCGQLCWGQPTPDVAGTSEKVHGETKGDDALSALTWISPQRLGVSGGHTAKGRAPLPHEHRVHERLSHDPAEHWLSSTTAIGPPGALEADRKPWLQAAQC